MSLSIEPGAWPRPPLLTFCRRLSLTIRPFERAEELTITRRSPHVYPGTGGALTASGEQLLVDFFYAPPVGHAVEALHYCLGHHLADPIRDVAVVLNVATAVELASIQIALIGMRSRDTRTTTSLAPGELAELLGHRSRPLDCFDIGLAEQLAVTEACDPFLAPHAGFGMAALAVGTLAGTVGRAVVRILP